MPAIPAPPQSPISIHAPLAGCDSGIFGGFLWMVYFNPRTPCGVRRRWETTKKAKSKFQSTHPLRGATIQRNLVSLVFWQFQSTHPLRGATCGWRGAPGADGISIHAPLAGCDAVNLKAINQLIISIHAPLAGCDPSLRSTGKAIDISIHAPLAGCDRAQTGSLRFPDNFNPRTPCGVRHRAPPALKIQKNFNPRTPCGVRLDHVTLQSGLHDFNPRTPCGVRLQMSTIHEYTILFQSTHPLRGATLFQLS